MLLIPAPMISAPKPSWIQGKVGWLTSHRAKPDDSPAISNDSKVRVRSYPNEIGRLKASMPMKCIDQIPKPMANAPPLIHRYTARPLAVAMRPVRSSAV
ncbi:hypothetical protein D3C77_443770 [compost metagenome]